MKFLHWCSAELRRHLMGLPLPWFQLRSPWCCLSLPHTPLTDVAVRLKRYTQFHPTGTSNWVNVMAVVTEPSVWFDATCAQSDTGILETVKHHLYQKLFSCDANQTHYSQNVFTNAAIILPSTANIHRAIDPWRRERILSPADINVSVNNKPGWYSR